MTDYDTPRTATIELEPEPLAMPARRLAGPVDELADIDVDGYELPGFDIIDEELAIPIVAARDDEFRCHGCFLILHRQLHAGSRHGHDICRDCA